MEPRNQSGILSVAILWFIRQYVFDGVSLDLPGGTSGHFIASYRLSQSMAFAGQLCMEREYRAMLSVGANAISDLADAGSCPGDVDILDLQCLGIKKIILLHMFCLKCHIKD